MDAKAPAKSIDVIYAPRKMRCPKCGILACRKRLRLRRVRSLSFKEELWLDVQHGEYIAKCSCCVSFRCCPLGISSKAKYDDKVRHAVLDRVLKDNLNLSTV